MCSLVRAWTHWLQHTAAQHKASDMHSLLQVMHLNTNTCRPMELTRESRPRCSGATSARLLDCCPPPRPLRPCCRCGLLSVGCLVVPRPTCCCRKLLVQHWEQGGCPRRLRRPDVGPAVERCQGVARAASSTPSCSCCHLAAHQMRPSLHSDCTAIRSTTTCQLIGEFAGTACVCPDHTIAAGFNPIYSHALPVSSCCRGDIVIRVEHVTIKCLLACCWPRCVLVGCWTCISSSTFGLLTLPSVGTLGVRLLVGLPLMLVCGCLHSIQLRGPEALWLLLPWS